MILSAPNLLPNVWISLRDPRGFASALFSSGIQRDEAWRLLLLSSLLGVFVNHFATLATVDLDLRPQDMMSAIVLMNARMMVGNPFIHATMSLSIMVISVYAAFWAGRWAGGIGEMPNTVLSIAWVGFVWSVLALLQLLVWFVSPPLAALVSVGVTAGSLWILTNFIAELHGFHSIVLTFAGIVATFFGMVFGFSLLVSTIGISLPGV